ncbi:hypothetical protein B0J11DRAFT_562120 [Dendryphion nanum]|uniref:25S rRNA (Uridine(2843)-N(3))-methyltransferase n=1 Tax=Dendryphion nanum TaxID=256645 RepID=A0A9P9D742_9PLEO|nr:hypothetical protein B0J11DRAFT_562120 [Dendryphion nanum]
MPPPKAKAKKKTKPFKINRTPQEPIPLIPEQLQQQLLNVFQAAFRERLESDIQPLLQEVKGHLFNRDFAAAFGRNDYLEAYAARWSPSRSLGYVEILATLEDLISRYDTLTEQDQQYKIVCIGGGAGAEIVALGGLVKYILSMDDDQQSRQRKFNVVAIDIADWAAVVEKLRQNIVMAPTLSKYASAAAKATNAPLIPLENLSVVFHQKDVLNIDHTGLNDMLRGSKLVTIMFTLNELYSTSVPHTQTFLLNLTASVEKDTLLLVVDSPGSYSTVTLNGTEKRYPMQWLLDHTLLKEDEKGEAIIWEKVLEDESRWWRQGTGLKYPIELENMRFQLHLYRRLA